MGNGISVCFTGGEETRRRNKEMNMMISDPYDEGLGHSFCYVRPDLTTTATTTTRTSVQATYCKVHSEEPVTMFRSISGASVSANTSTPLSTTFIDSSATTTTTSSSAFESSTSFASIPLQPIPRNSIHSGPFFSGSLGVPNSGPLADRGFLSGPIERGFLSGPLDRGGSLFSGPLEKGPSSITSSMSFQRSLSHGGWSAFGPRSRPRSLIRGLRRAISKTLIREQSSIVAPIKGISSIKYPDNWIIGGGGGSGVSTGNEKHNELTVSSVNFSSEGCLDDVDSFGGQNLQWAQGKAGEDRVHVVVSEEHGWVFVGIYDGFNGPDATDFLLSHLYPAVYKELKGLLWDDKSESSSSLSSSISSCSSGTTAVSCNSSIPSENSYTTSSSSELDGLDHPNCERRNRNGFGTCSQCLDQECYPCVSGESNFDSDIKRKRGGRGIKNKYRNVAKKWEDNQRRWKCEWDRERLELDQRLKDQLNQSRGEKPINHSDVLKALSQALKKTEDAYLDIADKMLFENPELALMGSCVLAMLMKGQDVYVMNVGDSRAVLAQKSEPDLRLGKIDQDLERINEETLYDLEVSDGVRATLDALQLTTDHSTSVEEEVQRIRYEHVDDACAVMNERVKGSLKVTRAFGAGFLKQPKWNDALLEMFRIDYVGTSPYISCLPYLYHHRLGPRDRFLILSSDGLYQYFTNEEAVSEVELFISLSPEGDPAQHLVEEVLLRAAKKAGMDFYELLEIPQGDRRRYHDDVSIIVISFEGRIWRSCV